MQPERLNEEGPRKRSCDSLNCMATYRGRVEHIQTFKEAPSPPVKFLQKWFDCMKKCDYCDRDSTLCKIKTIKGMNYCPKHLTQYYRHGRIFDKTIYDQNDYIVYENYAEIILRDKDCAEVGRAIIDIEDIERCKQYKWHIRKSHGKTNYVIASQPNNEKLHLHRFILGYNGECDVDHINRNGLDNRKSNLRVVPHRINSANNDSIGVKKVPSGRFQAQCCRNYKTIYIGTFNTFDEAVAARAAFIDKNT